MVPPYAYALIGTQQGSDQTRETRDLSRPLDFQGASSMEELLEIENLSQSIACIALQKASKCHMANR